MYCPNCGTQNDESNQFCLSCGQPLQKTASRSGSNPPTPADKTAGWGYPPRPPVRQRRSLWIWVGGGVALVLLLVAIYLAFSPGNKAVTPQNNWLIVGQVRSENVPEPGYLFYNQAFTSLYRLNLDGGDRIQLADNPAGSTLALNSYFAQTIPPQGNQSTDPHLRYLSLVDADGIRLVRLADGGVVYQYQSGHTDNSQSFNNDPVVSRFTPDGNYFVFSDTAENQPDTDTHLVRLTDMEEKIIKNTVYLGMDPQRERLLMVEAGQKGYQANIISFLFYDIQNQTFKNLYQLEASSKNLPNNYSFKLQFSNSGNAAYFCCSYHKVMRLSMDTGETTSLNYNGMASPLFLTADDRLLAMQTIPENGAQPSLVIYDLEAGESVYTVANAGSSYYWGNLNSTLFGEQPVGFSANNRYMTYFDLSDKDNGNYSLDIRDLESFTVQEVLKTTAIQNVSYRFSPDSRFFLYSTPYESGADGLAPTNQLFAMDIATGEYRELDTNVLSFYTTTSGQVFYYRVERDPNEKKYTSVLYRVRLDGTHRERLSEAEDGMWFVLN